MYKQQRQGQTSLRVNNSYKGETIEEKVRRLTTNREPIRDAGTLHYTERSEGVMPDFDIRADLKDIGLDAMTTAAKSTYAKRGQRDGERAYKNMKEEERNEFHKNYPHSQYSKDAAAKGEGNKPGGQSTHGK